MLFQLGDFYEMFFDDAVKASELLNIQVRLQWRVDVRVRACANRS